MKCRIWILQRMRGGRIVIPNHDDCIKGQSEDKSQSPCGRRTEGQNSDRPLAKVCFGLRTVKTKLDNAKGGSFRVASGDVLINLGSAKFEGNGAPGG